MGGIKVQALVVQNVAIEGPGLLKPAMEEAGWYPDIKLMDDRKTVLPSSLEGYRALILLGGPMNVYEEEAYPYLPHVDILIKEAIDRSLPVLGICLGGQLIAKALGAPVTRNPVREIGWYPLRLTAVGKNSPLFAGLPEEFYVFQWHEDTFSLPSGAIHLATSHDCVNQAFALGNNIFGLQFHVEVTDQMIETWAQAYTDELEEFGGQDAPARLIAETSARWEEYRQVAGCFLRNWLTILAETTRK